MSRFNALRLAFALCMITTAVNLQAPLYHALAEEDGAGVGATTIAFACYVVGIMPVLLALSGLPDKLGRRPLIVTALCLSLLATSLTIIAPGLVTLGAARFLMGIGAALLSAAAPAYMLQLFKGQDNRVAANWVTASTSLGFGLGAAVTSLFIMHSPSLTPPSLWLYLAAAILALVLVAGVPDTSVRQHNIKMLRPPAYPAGTLPFGLAILLAWATVGLVIAILPSTLAQHGLSSWSGFATFGICSCGVLFQPWARKLSPARSTQLGLVILPLSFALIAWGALQGSLMTVLIGTVTASSACYGFIYLGGMSGVLARAGEEQYSRASAGFFLMAYIGFSLPVVFTGALIDHFGHDTAFKLFGAILLAGVMLVSWVLRLSHMPSRQAEEASVRQD